MSAQNLKRKTKLFAFAPVVVAAMAAAAWLWSPRSFIAEDSYFYAVIARRIATAGQQSFSGVVPTNGFHPLWLYLLATYSRSVTFLDPAILWRAAFAVPLSLTLVGVSISLLTRIERTLQLPRACLVLPPVVFVCVLGVLYSEAHLLLATLAWLAWLIVRIDRGDQRGASSRLGVAAAMVVLARLDMVFVAVSALAWALTARRRGRISFAEAAGAFVAILLPYLVANVWLFGGVVPISGWLKSSFPLPTPTGFEGAWLSLSLSDYVVGYGVLPICIALAALGWTARRRSAHPVLVVFACGAAGHMAYTMLFASWCGWNWYYVLAMLAGTLGWALILRELRGAGARVAALQTVILVVVAAAGLVYMVSRDNRTPQMYAIQQYLASDRMAGRTVFVSELPGEAAFLGRANVFAADLLTANRRLYQTVVTARSPWETLLGECARAGHPIEEVIYVGGAFVARDDNALMWLDPKVSSRRPIATIVLGSPRIDQPEVPFVVWDVAPHAPGPVLGALRPGAAAWDTARRHD